MKKLIFLIVIFFSLRVYSQESQNLDKPDHCDSLSQKKFLKKMHLNYKWMKKSHDFTIQEMINLIRVYNTLQFEVNFEPNNKDKNDFRKLFLEKYNDRAAAQLECVSSQGNWYSPKYKLFITTGYHMRCDNYYVIFNK